MAAVDISFNSPYQGNLYVTWTHTSATAVIHFSRSSDGGLSFSDPLQISSSSLTHMSCPATGPNGEVYAVWFESPTETIRFDRSLDAGITWGPDIEVASFANTLNQDKPCGRYSTPSYPVVSCDLSSGPRRGWIYVCWANWNGHDSDILLCRSEDGGSTWSAPTRVNDDTTDFWQWWPWISVHPGTGALGCSWLDCREDPQGCLYRSWGSISYDGGETWIENMPIASEPSDPADIRFLGDYCGLTYGNGGFYAGWVDTRNDDGDCYVAWFGDSPYGLLINREGNHARLSWNPVFPASYRVFYGDQPDGPFHTLVGITTDTFIVDSNAFSQSSRRCYQVLIPDE